jgi:hypothetical protein
VLEPCGPSLNPNRSAEKPWLLLSGRLGNLAELLPMLNEKDWWNASTSRACVRPSMAVDLAMIAHGCILERLERNIIETANDFFVKGEHFTVDSRKLDGCWADSWTLSRPPTRVRKSSYGIGSNTILRDLSTYSTSP